MLRDVLGERATTELAEELNVLYEQLQILGWREMRPWGEFMAGFKVPEMNAAHLEERITTNFLHYRSNYAAVCGVLILLQVFLSPMLLVAVPLAVVLCTYVLIVHKRPIKISDVVISTYGKQTSCAIFCLFFFAISGVLERLVWIIIYCVGTCGLHLVFRPRNLSAKANKVYEELKLNGYTSWFSGFTESSSAGGADSYTGTFSSRSNSTSRDQIDPENPVEREQPPGFVAPSFGYSSNVGSTGSGDMRKRGAPLSYTSANMLPAGTNAEKHD